MSAKKKVKNRVLIRKISSGKGWESCWKEHETALACIPFNNREKLYYEERLNIFAHPLL